MNKGINAKAWFYSQSFVSSASKPDNCLDCGKQFTPRGPSGGKVAA